MRKLLAIVTAGVLAVGLAGCSSINSEQAMYDSLKASCGDVTTAAAGATVSSIDVSKNKGVPVVTFATPLVGKAIETKVVTAGTGPKITGNQDVEIEFEGVNAGNGKVFQKSSFLGTDTALEYLYPSMNPPFCKALGGVREGSRVVVYVPSKLGHNNQGVPSLNIGKSDGIIFIFDIKKVYLPYAVGNAQSPKSGFPAVVRAADGRPGVTIQSSATPPTTTKDGQPAIGVETLIEGAGQTVKQGDSIVLHYAGYLWSTGEKFDSSWTSTTGEPVSFTLTPGSLIPGFLDAIVGQKVGSQVVAVIPPNQGYKDVAQGSIPANSTLVFVIDILGIKGK